MTFPPTLNMGGGQGCVKMRSLGVLSRVRSHPDVLMVQGIGQGCFSPTPQLPKKEPPASPPGGEEADGNTRAGCLHR